MKTTAFLTSIIALAGVAAANSCVKNEHGLYTYTVTTDSTVPDISGVCGGLWDNLKQFSQVLCERDLLWRQWPQECPKVAVHRAKHLQLRNGPGDLVGCHSE
ncbi:hypothetical protein BKA70DRAFT_1235800 [Coprinopsis sp. MPI-PUGE-AT-0042]|nr:hypothetical protein BKA70DRAFT_1235800 [Coprinopsis sp. MPI-PUGE-AT-0042]